MRRAGWIAAILLSLLLLCWTAASLAEEAPDITESCAIQTSDKNKTRARMTDGQYKTHWQQKNKGDGWVEITAPEGGSIGGLSVCFSTVTVPWRVETETGDGWETVFTCETAFLHESVQLGTPAAKVRLIVSGQKTKLCVSELKVYGPGELPASAQHWEPTHGKADILFLAAHPDDELIFFGGGIPTYDTERGYRVVVAYLVNCGEVRVHELLDGLWSMGVRHYPVIGPYADRYSSDVNKAYSQMGGKKKVFHWAVALVRQYKPDVAVTHAWGGEYGHGQHQAAARAMANAWKYAADPAYDPASAQAYGTWQMQKLYLHLWKENTIQMDWSRPLASLDGVTGIEAAERAFGFHVSQHSTDMDVTHTGTRYDNRAFGLYATEVGPDTEGGDFMENVPIELE